MAAVVTGAAGFIGRALVRALLDAGTHVVGVDRRFQPGEPGLTVLTADLLDGDERVREALASADAVFHLAGCPGVREHGPDVELRRHRDNPLATASVLAPVPARTPLVVTSSSSVYGGTAGVRPCRETDRLQPRGGYARSKVLVERLCLQRLGSGGAVAIARPFTVAGEGQRPDMALARWVAAAREGRPLRVFGSLQRTRDITDVRDMARVLVVLAEAEARGIVNIGTGVGRRLAELVRTVGDVVEVEVRVSIESAAPEEASDTLAGTARLRRLAGFVPATDLGDVVARQAAASEPARGCGHVDQGRPVPSMAR